MKSTIRRMAIRVTTKPQATWDDARLVKEYFLDNEEAWSALIESTRL